MTVVISAVGDALPGEPIDNATLSRHVRTNPEWIEMFVGNRTRHFAVDLDTGRATTDLANLCARAGRTALDGAGLAPSDLDFLVLGTSTPDLLMPATVNVVAGLLGVNQVPTYQLQSGCAGAVAALDLGRMLLESGRHRTGLVLGGDVCRKHMDLGREPADLAPGELVNYALFGDGAGAAVVTTEPGATGVAIRALINRVTGSGLAPGQVVDWFGRGEDTRSRPAFLEDYKAIEASVPALAAEILAELLDECGWREPDVNWLLPPQLSGRMTARIVERLGFPGAKEISSVAETGNNGNALPFHQLRELDRVIAHGERAALVAVESSKWIKVGLALEGVGR